ncbi:uncharacterized protein RAG0_09112 [Rhynchosporium agropyri]|uniref:Uncharacterized protein n=1 Tax=Rhynchosporium agropyri TaxID=914238 RepID=A0A1E1KTZ1_9HELO|nr:uncharacterized protein RAG0_09112 [Rhynchosporium agropyri]
MFHRDLTSGEAGPVRILKLDFDFEKYSALRLLTPTPLDIHGCKCVSGFLYLDPHPHVIVHYVCAMATLVFMMSIL